MSPNHWGPPTWSLFHTLIEKLKEEKYDKIYVELFNYILQICHNLPCPTCTIHARQTLSGIKVTDLTNKIEFKNFLYAFHNKVSQRNNKPLFKYEDLELYKSKNVIIEFNNFSRAYTRNNNTALLADNFQRKQFIKKFKKWIMENMKYFDL